MEGATSIARPITDAASNIQTIDNSQPVVAVLLLSRVQVPYWLINFIRYHIAPGCCASFIQLTVCPSDRASTDWIHTAQLRYNARLADMAPVARATILLRTRPHTRPKPVDTPTSAPKAMLAKAARCTSGMRLTHAP